MKAELSKKLTITEIFFSIQGESYLAGLPCAFVRLTGCHQRCVYCDTEYAFYGGTKMPIGDISERLQKFNTRSVLITGGEPLLQSNVGALAQVLLDEGYAVAIETSGALDVRRVPQAVVKIMDLKTPGSGEELQNDYENLGRLDAKDEVKFVVCDTTDIAWSLNQIRSCDIHQICHASLSPTAINLLPVCADAILASGLPVRLQTQFHKTIWPEKNRGY